MRKGLKVLCVMAIGGVLLAGFGRVAAQEEFEPVTQAELASMLAKVLGLEYLVPPTGSPADYFKVLAQNGVAPLDGWKAEEAVTVNVLAVTTVQALKWVAQVEDPRDPASYVSLLQNEGIQIDTIGRALSYLKPYDLPVAPVVVAPNVDPAYMRLVYNPVDEVTFGADMTSPLAQPAAVTLPEAAVAPPPAPIRTASPI